MSKNKWEWKNGHPKVRRVAALSRRERRRDMQRLANFDVVSFHVWLGRISR